MKSKALERAGKADRVKCCVQTDRTKDLIPALFFRCCWRNKARNYIKMRTAKETAEIVEKTITEIREAENLTDSLISKTCLKYNISESHIRRVPGWKNEADCND